MVKPGFWVRTVALIISVSLPLLPVKSRSVVSGDESWQVVEQAIQHGEFHIGAFAMELLARLSDSRSGALLLKGLEDPRPAIRAAAANALRRRPKACFAERLQAAYFQELQSDSGAGFWIRLLLVEAVARSGASGVAQFVADAMADPDSRVRSGAAAQMIVVLGNTRKQGLL